MFASGGSVSERFIHANPRGIAISTVLCFFENPTTLRAFKPKPSLDNGFKAITLSTVGNEALFTILYGLVRRRFISAYPANFIDASIACSAIQCLVVARGTYLGRIARLASRIKLWLERLKFSLQIFSMPKHRGIR